MRGRVPDHQAKQRVTVEITDELFRAVRAKAQRRGEAVAAVIRRGLEQYASEDET